MKARLKKYTALSRIGILSELHFRLSTFVVILGNLVYLTLVYFLWKSIYASSGTSTVNGMSFSDTLIYLVLATALFNFLEMYMVWEISRDIQSGGIILKLLKPMSFRSFSFWNYFGRNIMTFFLTFLPTFIVIDAVTKGYIHHGFNLIYFVISVIMALIINFNIDLIVSTICLYTESTWGINMVKECIVLLLSGATIPLAFFPEKLRHIVTYLPFKSVYDTPLNILLQKKGYTTPKGLLFALGLQLSWCIILYIISKAFWNHSIKRITVNGG
ncbi:MULTISPECIES: ABC transporter permease [Eubacterium]|jgi:ABC-2 type transport system permease protein|uniref:ABC-2 type transport system permease protein n=1 Tax=Eubacterium ruminantium TaxID=42322 RepID=A0A1T4KG52_9FIRM|nr:MULTISPECIES: ABC-2 family transporter protein [Eubacterium]MCR5368701.1 ABC-2 family transporter protein [Eubacterium sp.]SCW31769.1 ABC-2 type transport system permease protein [Eubacterium ruminantium]SDM26478.1 ABC-2 type transport system permease protein [Eubacterium ruminantium]SJZ41389.1 ABC-2 type transport system permease protein [Eubacterium ruminantium]